MNHQTLSTHPLPTANAEMGPLVLAPLPRRQAAAILP